MLKIDLPFKPSELIRLAMSDLDAAEKNPEANINMNVWFGPKARPDGKCAMCLAGAVMFARTPIDQLTGGSKFERTPSIYDEKTNVLLRALDHFRVGSWGWGLKCCIDGGLSTDAVYSNQEKIMSMFAPHPYHSSAELFKLDMAGAADTFEAMGL